MFSLVVGTSAFVISIFAAKQIKATEEKGIVFAILGIIFGSLFILYGILCILLFIGLFDLIEPFESF